MTDRRCHLRPRPTRATGRALVFIGGYVVLANLIMAFRPAGLLPGGQSFLYLIGGIVITIVGLAVG